LGQRHVKVRRGNKGRSWLLSLGSDLQHERVSPAVGAEAREG
jgi:hypothetical protein